jgi:L-ascorbate metabolism protein UlaG (beta-lactamase superfamily)
MKIAKDLVISIDNLRKLIMPISITWFPPSWLLIKTKDQIIYIDPAWIQKNFDKYPKKIIFSHYPDPMDGLPEADLPKADIILVTHHHQDHIKTVTLNRLAKKSTRIFAPSKCAGLIGRLFEEVNPDDEHTVGSVKIKAVFAYNTPTGNSTHKVHHKG